jgi:hypothetical protein
LSGALFRPVLIRFESINGINVRGVLYATLRLHSLMCGQTVDATVRMTGGEFMESIEPGAAEACVHCQDGDSCNGDWSRYKSGYARYLAQDTFGEELQSEVRVRLRSFDPLAIVTLVLSVFSLAVFLLSFIGKESCCGLEFIDKIAGVIEKLLSLFGRKFEANACLVRTFTGSLGLFSTSVLVGHLDCGRRAYRKIIELFKDAFGDARPIFLGSGQLQFSIGDCGIAVQGGNSVHHFNWAAVDTARLVKKGSAKGPLWLCRANLPSFKFGVKPLGATHLIVHMKRPRTEEMDKKARREAEKARKKLGAKAPLGSKDFLVIPEHFFHAPVDGCVWREFLGHFHKHICVAGWTEE